MACNTSNLPLYQDSSNKASYQTDSVQSKLVDARDLMAHSDAGLKSPVGLRMLRKLVK